MSNTNLDKTKLFTLIAIITIISVCFGLTYAFFTSNTKNTDNQKINIQTGTLQLVFSDNDDGISAKLAPGDSVTKKFTLENTGTAGAFGKIEWKDLTNTYRSDSLSWVLYESNTEDGDYIPIVNGHVPTTKDGTIYSGMYVDSGKKKYYSLTITLDNLSYVNQDSDKNALLNTKFTMEAGTSNFKTQKTLNTLSKLNANIKLNTSTLNYKYSNEGKTINMSDYSEITDSTKISNGIYQTPDEKGESYIFRGNIDYNYLKFAGFYWRIVRINGDGTLRLIYDGTKAHANNDLCTDSNNCDRSIGTSAFNTNYDDNAYIGYMYGTPGSNNYNATHANTNDSKIKTYIDNWYKTNIAEKNYGIYVADEVFCNDRSITGEVGNMSSYTQKGYGFEMTKYGFNERIDFSNNDVMPTLMCPQKNDAFTVSDTTSGNGKLIYPVGLLTTDEIYYVGGAYSNSNYYLNKGIVYWTLSPDTLNYGDVNLYCVGGTGNAQVVNYVGNSNTAVVPVINLTNDAVSKLTGNGTMNSPFEISNQ